MSIKHGFAGACACAALLVLSLAWAVNVSGQRSRGEKESGKESSREAVSDDQWEYLVVTGGNLSVSSISGEQFSGMRKQPENAFTREAFVLERNMDKLGAKGWQLVSVHGAPNDPIFYFKRPKDGR